jgi:hypothetical protein
MAAANPLNLSPDAFRLARELEARPMPPDWMKPLEAKPGVVPPSVIAETIAKLENLAKLPPSQIHAAIQSTGSPVIANWNIGGSPGSSNATASAGVTNAAAWGLGAFAGAVLRAANLLNVMNTRASSLNDQFQSLATVIAQLSPAFGPLIARATSSQGTAQSTSSPARSASGGVTITGGINVPTLDVNDATTQIAAKLRPVVADMARRIKGDLEAAARALQTQGGL